MNSFILGLAVALASTNPAVAASNVVEKTTGVAVAFADSDDPVEKEYNQITEDDDTAQEEIDKWIRDANAFAEKGAADPRATLNPRIKQRLEPVRKGYEAFLQRHPDHVRARLAFGSFLNDSGNEEAAVAQWEKARELDPKNPAPWNNLATFYGHSGPVTKAFEYFAKAIELKPGESLYYHNLAVHVYLFRKDAKEYYHLTESEVFDKSLDLYRKAIKLDPKNFILATDFAECFYGTNPPRLKEGLVAWENALKLAADDIESQGVYLHLARIKTKLGMFEEARRHLDAVTDNMYMSTKKSLTRNLNEALEGTKSTNTVPVQTTTPQE